MKTYVTFGSTNPYQAQGNGLFRGRTRIAIRAEYCDASRASEMLMNDCLDESDMYAFVQDNNSTYVMNQYGATIMAHGDMAYEHDGYTYESIALDELDEEDALIALRDAVLSREERTQLEADLEG